MIKRCLLSIIVPVLILSFAGQGLAQQAASPAAPPIPPTAQQAINQGQVTPQQVQEGMKAVERGQISPEAMKQLQEKGGLGNLTPQEIEAGKKMLEQKTKEAPKPKAEEKAPAELKPEEKKPAGKQEAAAVEDEYFRKTPSPEAPSLEIFGHQLFSAAPSTFAPITSIPVSNDYIIGPGDEIKVLMWGRLDAFYTLEVDNEGVINFPKVGPLTVAGLTFGEIKELIRAKAESITGVNVNVSMGKLRTIQVFVLGEVKSPGVFTVSSLATMTNALLASGGPTALGSLRKVELKRHGKTVTVIDLYDFLLKGDTSADMRLMPGDSIFIPQTGPMVAVSGNVKRPSIYEMKDDRTLQNAIDLAGGLRPRAYNQRIQIERAFQNRVQIVLDISYEELLQKKPIPLMDGDLIRIFSIHPASVNAVYLFGNVIRPGEYAYVPGLRVLNVIPDLQSLDMDTYFDYALVKRYRFEDSKSELIPFHLGGLLVSRDLRQNIVLKPKDEIYIFNKKMFQDPEHAVVEGQVRKPGRYPIEDMRVRDLIFKAGNLTKDAYMELGHLYRTDPKTKEVTMVPFNVAKVMEGDPLHNLPLKDYDLIVILSQWDYVDKYTLSISGNVNRPGTYPYATNMTVRDLILVGGNVMESAYLEKAELVRYNIVQGKRVETSLINFDISLALKNDPAHNLKLKPFDVVNVKEIPEWKEKRTVAITGEVTFPGTYQIRKEERLSSLIERAGGFTENAYLRGALFTRESVRRVQQQRLGEMISRLETEIARYSSKEAQATLSQEDVAAQAQFISSQKALVAKLQESRASGRVVISLLPTSVLKDVSLDMVLESGDNLYIPPSPGTVNVLGEVYNPSALVYEKERTELAYYLRKTGGPTENAEDGQMYVVRMDGTVISKTASSWFGITWSDEENRWQVGEHFEDTKLHPGDTVVVPQKIVKPSFMKEVKDITQILYQIAVTAGVLLVAF